MSAISVLTFLASFCLLFSDGAGVVPDGPAAWSWRDTNTKHTKAGATLAASGDQTAPINGLPATIDSGAIAVALATSNGPVCVVDGPAIDPLTGCGDLQSRAIPGTFSILLRVEVVAKDANGQPEQDIDGNFLMGLLTKDFYFHGDPSLFPSYPAPGAGYDTFAIRLDTGYLAQGMLGGGNVEIEVTDVQAQAESVAATEPSFEI